MKYMPLLLLVTLAIGTTNTRAQHTLDLDADDVDVSYVYAAVMGTGTYKINGRRITQFQLPLSFTQREMTAEQAGLAWTLPVSLGYDTVTDHDWFGDLLDEDLVTLTVLPGFEYRAPLDKIWTLTPFGNLGLGRDFSVEENVWMGVLGLSVLGTWHLSEDWELRWGGAVQFAGEYQTKSHHRTSFSLIETGVDMRWNTPLMLADRVVNAGAYYILQYYIPEWDIDRLRPRESDIGVLHELGLSVGLQQPITFLGVSFSRIRVGYNRGSGVKGWSFGTEFPF